VATAKVNDIDMAYTINGSGDPIVLIGGYTMVKEGWAVQVDALAEHFKVITFDNRGVGESTIPSEPFTVADMAYDIVGLMDALGIDKACFFGVSMGGLIAQILALDYPDRVEKIVLGCTTHGGRHAVQPKMEVMAILGSAADQGMSAEESIRLRLPIVFSDRFLSDKAEKVEEFVRMSLQKQPTPKGAEGQMAALSVFNVKRRLEEIRCPVLVITGTEDRMMPSENSRLLAEGISGAELYRVEGAGHGFYQEKPDEVNRVLIKFLKK